MEKASPQALIVRIDRKVDAVMAALCTLEVVSPLSAASWQRAWDKHPDLYARHSDLFRQRGEAQRERDAIEGKRRVRIAA